MTILTRFNFFQANHELIAWSMSGMACCLPERVGGCQAAHLVVSTVMSGLRFARFRIVDYVTTHIAFSFYDVIIVSKSSSRDRKFSF